MSAFMCQRALCLVRKNGAGKTTLMRIICGLTQQSAGNYTLLGKSMMILHATAWGYSLKNLVFTNT